MAGSGTNQYFQYQSGLGSIGSYQISGIPFVTSSVAPAVGSTPAHIAFDKVSKFIIVKNVDTGGKKLRVGFSENGVNGSNYFLLGPSESFAADIRVTDVYLLSDNGSTVNTSLVAGLTGITKENLTNNWSGSLGVG